MKDLKIVLDNIHVIGDRVLVKLRKESERTQSGLYLPPELEKKKFNIYVVKSGPGYPIPNQTDVEEAWKEESKAKVPSIASKTGDLAVFYKMNLMK